jgi:hypothetical protein
MLQERGNPQSGFLFVSQTKGKGEQLEVRSINEAMKALAQKSFDKEKAQEFKTKTLRSFYNSALLHAGISPQELKDLMFGHGRKGARGHYDYDEQTIKEAYQRVFEHLSINGLQVRADLKKVMDTLKGLTDTNAIFQRQLEAKDKDVDKIRQDLEQFKKTMQPLSQLQGRFQDNERLERFLDLFEKAEQEQSQYQEDELVNGLKNRNPSKSIFEAVNMSEHFIEELEAVLKSLREAKAKADENNK